MKLLCRNDGLEGEGHQKPAGLDWWGVIERRLMLRYDRSHDNVERI